ncbi:MAG: hypothetical protein UT92_C0004G0008 [Candidatus Curtissbacteria bacterium GW2011_GWA1_40_24]|uniref:DUF5667 domain-containing protein n=1 Tax=Candidatus Curtissbacteria bacterium GW2011_GWA1_40_24 TaxID=1618406 RepID=A0A0G0UZ00_9BACT|nr:MAG: hypothetical protein UT92_C0004G0008 [Candidatus Curtissbacteria bacterium GW2011_GWA1_40_24]
MKTNLKSDIIPSVFSLALSSRGLGRAVLIRVTGVQIPVAPQNMKVVLACFTALFFLAFFANIAFAKVPSSFPEASAGEINEAVEKLPHIRILPSNPLHVFIRVKENVSRFFNASSIKRAEFDLVLSGKRLKEAYLFTEKSDVKNTGKSLSLYGNRLEKLTEQMEKARSQNQDVLELSEKIADELALQERLLYVISQKSQDYQNSYNFGDIFQRAKNEFKETVSAIDNVKPGLKDRFPYLWN